MTRVIIFPRPPHAGDTWTLRQIIPGSGTRTVTVERLAARKRWSENARRTIRERCVVIDGELVSYEVRAS